MDRIVVIGCSAAGKSTVARRLGSALGIDVIHLDTILWRPGCKLAEPHEEHAEVEDALADKDRWISDGNYTASLPARLERADTVVLIDFPRWRCLLGAMRRLWQHGGRTRPDMGDACPEQFNLGFLKWIWQYPCEERPRLMRQIKEHAPHARLVVLHDRQEVEQFLADASKQAREQRMRWPEGG